MNEYKVKYICPCCETVIEVRKKDGCIIDDITCPKCVGIVLTVPKIEYDINKQVLLRK